jgi:hypothetical protein
MGTNHFRGMAAVGVGRLGGATRMCNWNEGTTGIKAPVCTVFVVASVRINQERQKGCQITSYMFGSKIPTRSL